MHVFQNSQGYQLDKNEIRSQGSQLDKTISDFGCENGERY